MTPESEWLRLCKSLLEGPSIPLSDEEWREFNRSCDQEVANAEWRRRNPPQKDLFHRG